MRISFIRKVQMHKKARIEIKQLQKDIMSLNIIDENYKYDIFIYQKMIEERKHYTFYGW